MGSHEVDPRTPVHRLPFTLQPNETRDFQIPGSRVLYLMESVVYGTVVGDLSIAFGETGSFFLLAPADGFMLTQFDRVRVRNNTATAKSGTFAHSADENFRVLNQTRGV